MDNEFGIVGYSKKTKNINKTNYIILTEIFVNTFVLTVISGFFSIIIGINIYTSIFFYIFSFILSVIITMIMQKRIKDLQTQKEYYQYIVEYNIENSKKTMTTQEIIDTIYNKNHFEDTKGKTSKVVIYVKGRENIKLIKQILKMNNNTNFIKEKKQKEKEQEEQKQREQYNELSQKYLNETHKVNVKK